MLLGVPVLSFRSAQEHTVGLSAMLRRPSANASVLCGVPLLSLTRDPTLLHDHPNHFPLNRPQRIKPAFNTG
jgi:hypothetical protein